MRAPVVLALLGLLGSSPVQSQVIPATLEVVDASGTVIGPVLDDLTSVLDVPLLVDSHLIRARVRQTHMTTFSDYGVYFTSSDCSGQAFTNWNASTFGDPFSIVTLSNSVFVGMAASPLQSINVGSHLAPGISGCQLASGLHTAMVPVSFIRDLSPPFQPPFSLRASPSVQGVSVPAVGMTGLALLAATLALLAFRLLRRAA